MKAVLIALGSRSAVRSFGVPGVWGLGFGVCMSVFFVFGVGALWSGIWYMCQPTRGLGGCMRPECAPPSLSLPPPPDEYFELDDKSYVADAIAETAA